MASQTRLRVPTMNTTRFSIRRLSCALALVLSSLPALVSAQDADRAPVKPAHPALAIANGGSFKSTDGTTGTYKETEILYDLNRRSSRTLVFTRASDQATRTEKTDYLTNPDGTHTENVSVTDYGAAAAFTSSRMITTLGRGQSTGRGVYTTADGVSGTLTTLETGSTPGVNVLTTVYNSPTAGLSTEQRTQTILAAKIVIKTVSVDASGASSSEIQTRNPANLLNGVNFIRAL